MTMLLTGLLCLLGLAVSSFVLGWQVGEYFGYQDGFAAGLVGEEEEAA